MDLYLPDASSLAASGSNMTAASISPLSSSPGSRPGPANCISPVLPGSNPLNFDVITRNNTVAVPAAPANDPTFFPLRSAMLLIGEAVGTMTSTVTPRPTGNIIVTGKPLPRNCAIAVQPPNPTP